MKVMNKRKFNSNHDITKLRNKNFTKEETLKHGHYITRYEID